MAREPTYGSRATHPPHWGSTRTEPDLHRHPYTDEAKERVQFWSVPRYPFTTNVVDLAYYVTGTEGYKNGVR